MPIGLYAKAEQRLFPVEASSCSSWHTAVIETGDVITGQSDGFEQQPGISSRDRLLAGAAREVFSEHGFQGATVREICCRAEVNLAAVNYHFSGKEALFVAALNFEPLLALKNNVSRESGAEARLQRFIGRGFTRLDKMFNGEL